MKHLSKILTGVMLVCCAIVFAACGGGQKTLFVSDFTNGNNDLFRNYGSVTDNDNGTITLNKSTDADNGAMTYFGEEDRNFEWVENGYTASITFKIDGAAMTTGQGFTWTVSINDENKEFVDERNMYFRKYDEGVKVGYVYNGSNDAINADATSNEGSVLIPDGWYTANYTFYDDNNVIKLDMSLVNEAGTTVFTVKDAKLSDENDAPITLDTFSGIRYGWVSWMTISNLEVREVKVYQ